MQLCATDPAPLPLDMLQSLRCSFTDVSALSPPPLPRAPASAARRRERTAGSGAVRPDCGESEPRRRAGSSREGGARREDEARTQDTLAAGHSAYGEVDDPPPAKRRASHALRLLAGGDFASQAPAHGQPARPDAPAARSHAARGDAAGDKENVRRLGKASAATPRAAVPPAAVRGVEVKEAAMAAVATGVGGLKAAAMVVGVAVEARPPEPPAGRREAAAMAVDATAVGTAVGARAAAPVAAASPPKPTDSGAEEPEPLSPLCGRAAPCHVEELSPFAKEAPAGDRADAAPQAARQPPRLRPFAAFL